MVKGDDVEKAEQESLTCSRHVKNDWGMLWKLSTLLARQFSQSGKE